MFWVKVRQNIMAEKAHCLLLTCGVNEEEGKGGVREDERKRARKKKIKREQHTGSGKQRENLRHATSN